jgi:hypothetical protein
MNRFLPFWSVISPVCLALVTAIVSNRGWYPGHWALQQSVIFGFYHNNAAFAQQWFLTTSITGFFVMLSHDLILQGSGLDLRGQGALYLVISLPILAIVGSLVLGLAQFLLLYRHCKPNRPKPRLILAWFVVSFLAWMIGFGGAWLNLERVWLFLIFAGMGTALKGTVLTQYLRIIRSSIRS